MNVHYPFSFASQQRHRRDSQHYHDLYVGHRHKEGPKDERPEATHREDTNIKRDGRVFCKERGEKMWLGCFYRLSLSGIRWRL